MDGDTGARDPRPFPQPSPGPRVIQLADYDPLTRLPTERAFSSALAGLLASDTGGKRPALLAFGIDGFSQVNASFGAATGDVVLRTVGQMLAAMIGQRTVLSRLTGDAFAIFLPGNGAQHTAQAFARRLARRFAEGFRVQDHDFRFTLSIGIAYFPAHGVDAAALIRGAQDARHRARNLGGNRIL
jgi:diguanylate cyclase (GGDEF)-like protein